MSVTLGTDVTNAPPIDSSAGRSGSTPGAASGPLSSATPETQVSTLPGSAAAPVDRLNIQPLDLAGALRILVAEVQAELSELRVGSGMNDGIPPTVVSGAQAMPATSAEFAQVVVQQFLRALPENSLAPAAWLAVATRVEATLQRALDNAVGTVTAWRNVPATVVEGATTTRAVVLAAIGDDTSNPLWLRPEWLGLAPRMERYWRRRRFARRGLSDPDLAPEWPKADGCEWGDRDGGDRDGDRLDGDDRDDGAHSENRG